MKDFNWKHLVLLLLAIPIINQLAGYLGRSAGQQANKIEAANSPPPPPKQDIRVAASTQDSEGVTQQNFDLQFLKSLEAYTVERVTLKAKEFLASQGHANTQLNISSEAIYAESGPMKLAVIRLRGSDGSNQIFITGIVGNELKRVACIRNSTETIPISYGICAEKINEVFGIKIGL